MNVKEGVKRTRGPIWTAWEEEQLRAGHVELLDRRTPPSIARHLRKFPEAKTRKIPNLETFGVDPFYSARSQNVLAAIGIIVKSKLEKADIRKILDSAISGSLKEDIARLCITYEGFIMDKPEVAQALLGRTGENEIDTIRYHQEGLTAVLPPRLFRAFPDVGIASGVTDMKLRFRQLQLLSRLEARQGTEVSTRELSADIYNGREDYFARLDIVHHIGVIKGHPNHGKTFLVQPAQKRGNGYRFERL